MIISCFRCHFGVLKCLLVPIRWKIVIQPTPQKPSAHACPSQPQRTSRYHPEAPAVPPPNEFAGIRGQEVGCAGLSADRCGAGVGRFGGRKGVSRMVASVQGSPQLPLPQRLFWFSRGLFMSVLPHAPESLRRAVPRGRCMSASRNLARILLP